MEVKTSWASQPSHLLAECGSEFLPRQILTERSRRTIAQALSEVLAPRIMMNQEPLFKPLSIGSHEVLGLLVAGPYITKKFHSKSLGLLASLIFTAPSRLSSKPASPSAFLGLFNDKPILSYLKIPF